MNSRGVCLVVEDDPDILGLLCLILSRAGFEVHSEATGAGAFSASRALDLALITLAVGPPDMNGLDVARRIRKSSTARILMISGPGLYG